MAGVVPLAKDAGARVVIVNDQPTPLDPIADAVLRGSIGSVLPLLCGSEICGGAMSADESRKDES